MDSDIKVDGYIEHNDILSELYKNPIKSTRNGPIFNSHSYPTKINPDSIVPFILAHTKPGDVVFDGFAGSGATGIAATLCDNPDSKLIKSVESILGSRINWGARDAVIYDISELATFISGSILNPPNLKKFNKAVKEILIALEKEWGWLYATDKDKGTQGTIRYTIWTDHPICPYCGKSSTYWDLAVFFKPLKMSSKVVCIYCNKEFEVSSTNRLIEKYWDDLLKQKSERRVRSPVYVYGKTSKLLWKRPVNDNDLDLIKRIDNTPLPSNIPIVPMTARNSDKWGELYRSGYHYGITHVHHFYTRRNLIAVAAAWKATEYYPEEIKRALKFWISSYNTSHSTLMTRVVCKKKAKDLVCTSAQPATLYISSLPVEKNVFYGLKNKLNAAVSTFRKFSKRNNDVSINCASSLKVTLPSSSVDYIFTDPPFGENIQYAEVNFISEAWLGKITKQNEEVIVSPYQNKSVERYGSLLTKSFSEAFRILKPGHYMTVVFHSTKSEMWNALQQAWMAAGFNIVGSSILDKTQSSFKQTTTKGAVKGDPIILLQKPLPSNDLINKSLINKELIKDPWELIYDRLSIVNRNINDANYRNKQRLYSYLVTYYLEYNQKVPINAKDFFNGLNERFKCVQDKYYIK